MPAQTLAPYLAKWKLPACPADRVAYFAGFFDGEGCIQLTRTPARNRTKNPEGGVGLTTVVVNTARAPLEEMQLYFGGTIHAKTKSVTGWRQAYYWMLHGKRAAYFVAAIRDSLVTKQKQADAVLVFAETYFASWRHCEQRGWPLTAQAVQLRRAAFFAFRDTMMRDGLGRGISWAI